LRSQRLRLTSRILIGCFGSLVVFFALWRGGQWAMNEFIFANPAFALHEIDAQTDGVISPDQIRRWAGVRLEDNLFLLDLPRIKRDLEMVPLIQTAAVERVLPHTLKLRISEREPVAQTITLRPRTGGGYEQTVYHLDAMGAVMLPLDRRLTTGPALPPESLPLLVGVLSTELMPGRKVESNSARSALRLIAGFDHSPMVGLADIRRVDVSAADVLRVTTGQGSEVVLALDNLEVQLRRWRIVHDRGLQFKRAIASLDLSVTNNIPARWFEASAVSALAPKPVKISRIRKKNV